MTMREKIVKYALECEGKHRSEVGCAGQHDWCAHFVSKVLEHCGIKDVSSTFVGPLRTNLLESGLFSEPDTYPIGGDIITIDWDHKVEERPLDHIIICVDFDEKTKMITYINGNGSSSEYVTKQQISVNSPAVMYWTRYTADDVPANNPAIPANSVEGLPTLMTGCKGSAVKTLQAVLVSKYNYELPKYGCDGDFGAETHSALKSFQNDNGLTADGVCGPISWNKLLK